MVLYDMGSVQKALIAGLFIQPDQCAVLVANAELAAKLRHPFFHVHQPIPKAADIFLIKAFAVVLYGQA